MSGNLGKTGLKCRRRRTDPMAAYDRLPKELRHWVSQADLPWRPESVRRAYFRAMLKTRNRAKALEELDRIERRLMSQDTGGLR